MKIKTSEASGVALDCLVAKAEGKQAAPIKAGGPVHLFREVGYAPTPFQPSTIWAQGGPIIEREDIQIGPINDVGGWYAYKVWGDGGDYTASTPLVAAMRCYVASKLGGWVEVPDELMKEQA